MDLEDYTDIDYSAIASTMNNACSIVSSNTNAFTVPPPHLILSGPSPVIETDKNKINLDELVETIEMLKDRLLIITPMIEKHELYPALKAAYEHYKLIERMVSEGK